ncbi:hypothetical protein [Alicyclobacillus ferrooxydans]|nr:hypothetical protein [Alicyclobacillus ferrooxydans]
MIFVGIGAGVGLGATFVVIVVGRMMLRSVVTRKLAERAARHRRDKA